MNLNNSLIKRLLLIFLIGYYQLFSQTNQVLDTINLNEVEWINSHIAHKKGVEEPFTGIVTFSGDLDYRKGISWRLRDNSYFSAANFVNGKFNGPYTIWYEKGGQKKSEISLLNNQRAEITLDGPSTEWYENGQIKSKGANYYGDIHGINFSWYEDGQMQSKRTFERGDPIGVHTAWHQNGQKSYEATYIDDEEIKRIEWDANGIKVNEWPKPDKDSYGLKGFFDEFVTILKSRDFNSIENLFMSKDKFFVYAETMAKLYEDDDFKNSSKYKEMIEQWKEFINYYIMSFGVKELLENDLLFDQYIKNGAIQGIVYDYDLKTDDNKTIKVKWPETINYDISSATVVYADVTILIVSNDQQYTMEFSPIYFNKKWYFIPLGS